MVKTKETYPKKLINVDNSKKLQEVLWKEETQKLLQKNYEKYKKLEEKIHILNKTQLDISKLKNELTWDIDERADKLLNLIEKEEKSIEYQTRKKFEEKQEKIKNELREKADKKIPFIWAMLFDWASDLMKPLDKNADWMDKFFWKIWKYFWTMFLWWLGLKEWFNKLQILKAEDNNDEKKEEKKSTNSEQVDNSPEEIIESKKEKYNKYWIFLIKSLWKEDFNSEDNPQDTFNAIKNKKYNELKTLKYNNLDKNIKSKIKENNLKKAKDAILSTDMHILYSELLTKDNFEKINSWKNTNKILLSAWIENFDWNWENLTIKQLSIFLSLAIIVSSIWWIISIWTKVKWLLLSAIEIWKDINIDDIKSDFKEQIDTFEKEVMPNKLIIELEKISDWNTLNYNKNDIINKLWDKYNQSHEKYIDQLLNFRDFAKTNILENPKYNLKKQDKIIPQIWLNDILNLYISFNWEIPKDINNIPWTKSAWIYILIINNLDNVSKGWYIAKLRTILSEKNNKIIEKNERDVLNLLLRKTLEKTILNKIETFTELWLGATLDTIKSNPEYIWYLTAFIAILKWTPAGKLAKLLKYIPFKKTLLTTWLIYYIYSELKPEQQKYIANNQDIFKPLWFDINTLKKENEKSTKVTITPMSSQSKEWEKKNPFTPEIVESEKYWISIKYNWELYHFDTGYQFFDTTPLTDDFNWATLDLSKISQDWKNIIIAWEVPLKISFKEIENALKTKYYNKITDTEYFIIKKSSKKQPWYSTTNWNLILKNNNTWYIDSII